LPIADDAAGAYLGVDLDPAALGTPGQVINFGGREFHRYVLAPRLDRFVEWIAGSYFRGRFALVDVEDEDVQLIATVDPRCEHFLDYVRRRDGILPAD
jgi:cell wall assembly regulator SMI1